MSGAKTSASRTARLPVRKTRPCLIMNDDAIFRGEGERNILARRRGRAAPGSLDEDRLARVGNLHGDQDDRAAPFAAHHAADQATGTQIVEAQALRTDADGTSVRCGAKLAGGWQGPGNRRRRQEIRQAEIVGDEAIARPIIELLRRSGLSDLALA